MGAGIKWFRQYDLVLAAGVETTIAAAGTQIACLAATANFQIAVDSTPFTTLGAGLTRTLPAGQEFEVVRVRNTSVGSNTISLQIGYGDLRDSRLTLTGAVTLSKSSGVSLFPDVTIAAGATTLFSGGTDRRRRWFQNLSTTITLHIGGTGGATPGAAAGLRLPPGEVVEVDSTGGINVYNPGSASATVVEFRTVD